MNRDPSGLDQLEREFNLQQTWISKGEHVNCFEFVNFFVKVLMKHFPELAAVQAGGGKMLAPRRGGRGVFEPRTIHMPYLLSAQRILIDGVVTHQHVCCTSSS